MGWLKCHVHFKFMPFYAHHHHHRPGASNTYRVARLFELPANEVSMQTDSRSSRGPYVAYKQAPFLPLSYTFTSDSSVRSGWSMRSWFKSGETFFSLSTHTLALFVILFPFPCDWVCVINCDLRAIYGPSGGRRGQGSPTTTGLGQDVVM